MLHTGIVLQGKGPVFIVEECVSFHESIPRILEEYYSIFHHSGRTAVCAAFCSVCLDSSLLGPSKVQILKIFTFGVAAHAFNLPHVSNIPLIYT